MSRFGIFIASVLFVHGKPSGQILLSSDLGCRHLGGDFVRRRHRPFQCCLQQARWVLGDMLTLLCNDVICDF